MENKDIALQAYKEIYFAMRSLRKQGLESFLPEWVQVNGETFYRDQILILWEIREEQEEK